MPAAVAPGLILALDLLRVSDLFVRSGWGGNHALNLSQKAALQHDILGQYQHLLESFLDLGELSTLCADRPTEADRAAEDWLAAIEDQQSLLNRVRICEVGILTAQLS